MIGEGAAERRDQGWALFRGPRGGPSTPVLGRTGWGINESERDRDEKRESLLDARNHKGPYLLIKF